MSGRLLKLSFKLLFFCILLIIPVNKAGAELERILSFHSDILVHKNASLTVKETITVRVEQREIKRGIYRDFPTRYKDKLGNNYEVGFSVLKVLRDGSPESYHFKDIENGVRTYIGKENVILDPGIYTYTII